jgi:hypothetical protein
MLQKSKKLLREHKQEVMTLVFIIVLSVFTFVAAIVGHEFDHNVLAKQRVQTINAGFQDEIKSALEKTKLAASEKKIINHIAENNADGALGELANLAKKYNLTTMVAVNKDGVAIARTPSDRTGDFVFQTTPWGKEAARGREAVLVDQGRSYPLIINSAVPIINDEEVEGAVFGGYILNNEYSKKFKEKYLKTKEEVAFYSVKTGIYGTSFEDRDTEQLFKLLFNYGSDEIQSGGGGLIRGKHFKINGSIFHIGNTEIYDIDGNKVGGMFLVIPVHNETPFVASGIVGLFILILLILHVFKSHKNNRIRVLIITLAFLLTAGSILISAKSIRQFIYNVTFPSETVYNSTIKFNPDADIFSGMNPRNISIEIVTGGEGINVAQASISYDPSKVRIEEILTEKSFCDQEFFLEKNIDNEKGIVNIVCGSAKGFAGDTAILAELVIQPLRTGEVAIEFGEDTAVFAHDGLGTSVLRKSTNGYYQFTAPTYDNINKNNIVLFSYSHPNPSRWYNKKDIHVEWINFGNYKNFAYAFDKNPNTVPDGSLITNEENIRVAAESNGIYYFHLTPLSLNPLDNKTYHIRFMVDTTPPKIPEIKSSAYVVKEGEVVRFEFLSNGDNESGVQKNFYVQIDGGTIWLPVTSQLYILFSRGNHSISLRIFDNADNFSDAHAEIRVE